MISREKKNKAMFASYLKPSHVSYGCKLKEDMEKWKQFILEGSKLIKYIFILLPPFIIALVIVYGKDIE